MSTLAELIEVLDRLDLVAVPREPTKAMLRVIYKGSMNLTSDQDRQWWADILAAAQETDE